MMYSRDGGCYDDGGAVRWWGRSSCSTLNLSADTQSATSAFGSPRNDDSVLLTSSNMSGDPIIIHAEVLANIRQTSVDVQLSTPATEATSAKLDRAGSRLIIAHAGVEEWLLLPMPVAPETQLHPIPAGRSSHSLRLPLDSSCKLEVFCPEEQAIPWTATDLDASVEIKCQACLHPLLHANTIKHWKDMPSDNWAEMMDLWHCHKPIVDDDNGSQPDGNATTKAYGANTAISAQPGTAFADITTLIIDPGDCEGVKVRTIHAMHAHLRRMCGGAIRRWPGRRILFPLLNGTVIDTTSLEKDWPYYYYWHTHSLAAPSTLATMGRRDVDCQAISPIATETSARPNKMTRVRE